MILTAHPGFTPHSHYPTNIIITKLPISTPMTKLPSRGVLLQEIVGDDVIECSC